jgi:hypothetical protein
MPVFRHVLTFVGQDGGSWNEVYYESASDISSAGLTNSFIAARLDLLAALNMIRADRMADVDQPRLTRSVNYNLNGTAGVTADFPLPNTDALVLALASSAGGSRKLWMRGCPQRFQAKSFTSGRDALPGFVQKLLDTFFAALARSSLGIRKISPQSPGPTTFVKILSVDGARKDGTSDVTLAAAPGYPFPARVAIGGASKKDLPYLNGQWSLVKAPVAAVVTIPYQTPNGLVITGGNGKMRQAIYAGVNVFTPSACAFDHYGSHATRTANFRSRGARRAARLRTSL